MSRVINYMLLKDFEDLIKCEKHDWNYASYVLMLDFFVIKQNTLH